MRRPILLSLLVVLAACPGAAVQRPYPAATPDEVLGHLRGLKDRAASLNAETRSDVRMGGDRVNVTVFMLARWGGKLRFEAHDPNGATAADLASDGARYCLLDVHANCGECGPATPDTVARLVNIRLEPDEVVAVLLGSAPILDGQATTEWDPSGGHEIVTIRNGERIERIVLDGKDRRWDVLDAELTDGGKRLWSVRHKDFHPVEMAGGGGAVRMPGASLFEEGGDTVRIQWKDQKVGAPIDDKSFRMELQPGLPVCGSRRSAL